ncbi:hypothetical protein LWI29_031146 [Acer saccharum]|uniref:Uncharacterized protein n=1 Tax=Acer saccharum TaxID=4024 RepID=A0AA39VXQ9_ACESA|nr:hypothetical protein LWI29_031146 [Acer saccharum]
METEQDRMKHELNDHKRLLEQHEVRRQIMELKTNKTLDLNRKPEDVNGFFMKPKDAYRFLFTKPELTELPGFNFDAEKNRYFPIKGPIPGTSRSPSTAQNSNAKPTQAINSHGTRARTSKLLLVRELSGNVLSLRKGKCNFKEEFQKRLVSQPTVWKYRTENIGDSALEQIRMDVITPEGEYETDFLLTGSVKGYLSVFEAGNVGQEIYNEEKCIPEQVWPPIKENKEESYKAPDLRLKRDGPAIKMSSTVSCIKSTANVSTDSYFNLRRALYPFMISDFIDSTLFTINVSFISYFVNTIDNPEGTGLGAALVNLDKGTQSWVFHCKSDVLALQLHPSMVDIQTTVAEKKFENQINDERLQPTAEKKAKNWIDDERLRTTTKKKAENKIQTIVE